MKGEKRWDITRLMFVCNISNISKNALYYDQIIVNFLKNFSLLEKKLL